MNMAWIKKVYLYLVSLVSLIILIIASIMLINMALKTWVFPKADNSTYYTAPIETPRPECANLKSVTNPDGTVSVETGDCFIQPLQAKQDITQEIEQRTSQKQRDAAQALAMIIVAAPVFLYHWKLARKET